MCRSGAQQCGVAFMGANLQASLAAVEAFVAGSDLGALPGWDGSRPWALEPLAQGEYNMNYVLRQDDRRYVVRVNVGTQIERDDQILYEYRALELLRASGVTPLPYWVDDRRDRLSFGVLIMEYLPGVALDYGRDLERAARLFARIHSLPVDPAQNHLIRETRPLSMTYDECRRLLTVYLQSDLGSPEIKGYMREVLSWAQEARHRERFFVSDPWPCVINTEVNSGNFIWNAERETLHLVDWEKPLWGDPSQDLSHFGVPTTTLWKTDVRLGEEQRRRFMDAYRDALSDAHLRDTIVERVRLRDPFNCLRGISWSAMAWVSYQQDAHALKNQDTFDKMSSYLDMQFLRGLFDPHMNAGG